MNLDADMNDLDADMNLDACGYVMWGGTPCGLQAVSWAKWRIDATVKVRGWCEEHANHPSVPPQMWVETLTRGEAEVWLIMES